MCVLMQILFRIRANGYHQCQHIAIQWAGQDLFFPTLAGTGTLNIYGNMALINSSDAHRHRKSLFQSNGTGKTLTLRKNAANFVSFDRERIGRLGNINMKTVYFYKGTFSTNNFPSLLPDSTLLLQTTRPLI